MRQTAIALVVVRNGISFTYPCSCYWSSYWEYQSKT